MIKCDVCGTRIDQKGDTFTCPKCGWTITVRELKDESRSYDDVPESCIACGGDYPTCTDRCPMFA